MSNVSKGVEPETEEKGQESQVEEVDSDAEESFASSEYHPTQVSSPQSSARKPLKVNAEKPSLILRLDTSESIFEI